MLEKRTIIQGAQIIDGSGSGSFGADILVVGDRIAEIGNAGDWAADETVDATALIACPGFIDVHSHDDAVLLDDPKNTPKISQGVTTVVVGNCGLSLAPLSVADAPSPLHQLSGSYRFADFPSYFKALEANRPAVNVAALVGHTNLRVQTMSDLTKTASASEIEAMKRLCSAALEAGAIGISSGLYYPPAKAADWQEVAELVKLVGEVGGVYAAHIRDEADDVLDAINEATRIARTGSAPLVISHHKVMGERNFGRSRETLPLIDAAAEHGKVGFDVYPYIAGASMLLPELAADSGRTIISSSETHPEFVGYDLSDVARELCCSEATAVERLSPGTAVYFLMDEADMTRILAHPMAMIGSDGMPGNHPHPRLWGTFTRVLGHFSRDQKLFSLVEAIHRMTGKPAEFFKLKDRGLLRSGAFADIVLFDEHKIIDKATFEQPQQASEGIRHVMVNGEFVWRDGPVATSGFGCVLRRSDGPSK